MKLKDFLNVFNGDVSITALHRGEDAEPTTITAVPIGNLMKGSNFVMSLPVARIDPRLDTFGALVWVDIPAEIMPGLIKMNDGYSISLEWEE